MNKYIDNIFKLLYSPIVTPYNLLENAKLKNYSYVKYYKNREVFVTEMKCSVDGEEFIFKYEFDSKDHLQKIKKISKNSEIYVFEMQKELHKAQNEYFRKVRVYENR